MNNSLDLFSRDSRTREIKFEAGHQIHIMGNGAAFQSLIEKENEAFLEDCQPHREKCHFCLYSV